MGNQVDVLRASPTVHAIDFDAFLAVNDTVVNHPWHFQLIAFSQIRMENNLAVHEDLVGDGLPFGFPNGAGARCSCSCQLNKAYLRQEM